MLEPKPGQRVAVQSADCFGGAEAGLSPQQFRNGIRLRVFSCRDGKLGKVELCGRLRSGDGCGLSWMTMLLVRAIGS
jgi:hypothetical protein